MKLTPAQQRVVIASEPGDRDPENSGVGIELRGSNYRVAKALSELGLGQYTHGSPVGDLYHNNKDGLALRRNLLSRENGSAPR